MNSRWRGLLLLLLALVSTGCVYRRMTILSDPPGARVFINNVEVGTTPCNVPTNAFIDHGNYKITLFKDGFEPYEVFEPVPPQWYEYPGIDFLAEVGPFVQRDRRVFTYQLQPMREKSGDELKQQADEFRQRGGGAVGMPVQPGTIVPTEVSPPPMTNPGASQPPPVRGPATSQPPPNGPASGNERLIPVPPQ